MGEHPRVVAIPQEGCAGLIPRERTFTASTEGSASTSFSLITSIDTDPNNCKELELSHFDALTEAAECRSALLRLAEGVQLLTRIMRKPVGNAGEDSKSDMCDDVEPSSSSSSASESRSYLANDDRRLSDLSSTLDGTIGADLIALSHACTMVQEHNRLLSAEAVEAVEDTRAAQAAARDATVRAEKAEMLAKNLYKDNKMIKADNKKTKSELGKMRKERNVAVKQLKRIMQEQAKAERESILRGLEEHVAGAINLHERHLANGSISPTVEKIIEPKTKREICKRVEKKTEIAQMRDPSETQTLVPTKAYNICDTGRSSSSIGCGVAFGGSKPTKTSLTTTAFTDESKDAEKEIMEEKETTLLDATMEESNPDQSLEGSEYKPLVFQCDGTQRDPTAPATNDLPVLESQTSLPVSEKVSIFFNLNRQDEKLSRQNSKSLISSDDLDTGVEEPQPPRCRNKTQVSGTSTAADERNKSHKKIAGQDKRKGPTQDREKPCAPWLSPGAGQYLRSLAAPMMASGAPAPSWFD